MSPSDSAAAPDQAQWRQRAVQRSLGDAESLAEQRVQEFLDAAWALIDERGSADFTIHEVIDRCNQSVRGFYQYFASKDELLLALFEDSVREQAGDLRSVVEQESDPLARLRAFTMRLYDWCEPADMNGKPGLHKHSPIAEFAVQLSGVDPTRVEAAMLPVSELLLELLDDAVDAGVVVLSDTAHAAVFVKQLVLYSWFRNRVIKDPKLHITAEEIAHFCLHGLGAQPPTA
jgi:AcrR family transcriptional regulator